jgi:hypothetical protein
MQPRHAARRGGALALLALIASTTTAAATLQSRTIEGWNRYVALTEARIARELAGSPQFLASDFSGDAAATRDAVRRGAIPVARLTARDAAGQPITVPDGTVAHWRGAVFVPGVTLATLLDRVQHPPEQGPHQPDVVALRVFDRQPDRLRLAIRMTRRQLVTVTYDTEHLVEYRRDGGGRASSRSVSTRIAEIEDAGTAAERARPVGDDRGFLWRMNSYWRYEQTTGGVIVELESVTLSRGVPFGFGRLVDAIADTIARESMQRTLDHLRRTYGARPRAASRS